MPQFNMNIISKKKAKSSTNKPRSHIVAKDIEGVIFIDINAKYSVKCGNNIYSIKPSIYNCKGFAAVYKRIEYDTKHTKYMRNGNLDELDSNYWIPFHEGHIATGNIIYDHTLKKEYFDIKDLHQDYNIPDAVTARKFFKEHFEEIRQVIIKRRC